MKFSYNWLKEIGKFKDTPEKLAEFLTLHVFEVESVEKKGGDFALDIKILPNRMSDASGHEGMAREISVLKKTRIKNQESRIRGKGSSIKNLLRVKIENPEDCSRYTARLMDDVKVGPSPEWLKEKLETCGLQSINNIVDAANYVMLELGQPLHVFDMHKLKSKSEKVKTIVVRRAKKDEKILALDEKVYQLSPEILVIADEKEAVGIAGTKGGKDSGVSDKTNVIVLEAANFNQERIRLGSRELGITTDASIRFSHGMDPNETLRAINRLAEIIQKVAGGNILQGAIDIYPKKRKEPSILLRPNYANRLIGTNLLQKFYISSLKQLGWNFKPRKNGILVSPPSNRLDIQIEEDVIEELSRILGYENIKPKIPDISMAPSARNDELFWEDRVKENLVGAGYTEHEPYEFTGDKELSSFFLDSSKSLELENPISPEAKYMVPRVLIKFGWVAAENLKNQDLVQIFGVAKSFQKAQNFPFEHKDLVLCLAQKGSSEEGFYRLKGVLDNLFEKLGITDHWYDDKISKSQKIFHPYRFAEIKIGDQKIGDLGELHPAVLENLKTKTRISVAEIDFEKLWKTARTEHEFRPIGKYPAIARDIALIVPDETRVDEVQEIIENTGGELLEDSDLFDYFQDDALFKASKKSLAFRLVFQSSERTLREEEVNAIMKKIINALEEKSWEVRK